MGQEFIYTGRDTEFHKKGNEYRIIETGEHWIKSAGFTIWMTTEEYPDTHDTNLGYDFSPSDFKRWFWKV